MSSDNSWCTIESDPGVFTELIEAAGVKNVQVEELYALDPVLLQELKPVYGLVFLFKWDEKIQSEKRHYTDPSALLGEVFFAKQVITNACATQAIISILMNTPGIDLGPNLTEFKEQTKDFPADMKGLALGNNEALKKAHNSFRRPESITIVDKVASGMEEAYHFIAYLPINGQLYELDGLQPGPIPLGPCTQDDWLEKITPIIQERIDKYAGSEIRFNLMAVIKNRKATYLEEIEKLETKNARITAKLSGQAMDEESSSDPLPQSESELRALLAANEQQIAELRAKIVEEEEKFAQWRAENIRRRHNYVPFLFNLLKVLAEKKQLLPLYEKAKQRYDERKAAKEKAKSGK